MPSPQTPLPERARGFENLQLFLAPLLLLWEKGLGDEGKRFVSQSGEIVKVLSKLSGGYAEPSTRKQLSLSSLLPFR
jgi:hypothetical protein